MKLSLTEALPLTFVTLIFTLKDVLSQLCLGMVRGDFTVVVDEVVHKAGCTYSVFWCW